MTFGELLAVVIGLLERSGIPYMITGSLASSYHGEPRATRDADIVIDPRSVGAWSIGRWGDRRDHGSVVADSLE